MVTAPLLVPATTRLVEGWTGPALAPPGSYSLLFVDGTLHGTSCRDWEEVDQEAALDIRRREVQARVLECLARAVGLEHGSRLRAGATWRRRGNHWILTFQGRPHIFGPNLIMATQPSIQVPTLADIDSAHPDANLLALQCVVLWMIERGDL